MMLMIITASALPISSTPCTGPHMSTNRLTLMVLHLTWSSLEATCCLLASTLIRLVYSDRDISFAAACLLTLPLTIVTASCILNLLVTGSSSMLPHFLTPCADLRYAIIHVTLLCLLPSLLTLTTNTRSPKFIIGWLLL